MTDPFWVGFFGVLGALGAVVTVGSILMAGYLVVAFARASLTVWRRRRR